MPTPSVLGRNGTYIVFRKLHTRVAAYRRYLRDQAASREEEALLGAKMVGRWQSGAPLALAPDARRARAGRGRRPKQCLPLRRRSARVQVPGRRARTPGKPARRIRWRRWRRRAAASHDPARHELRTTAARRRPGRRRTGSRHHLRVRRRAPEAPVRVRQDPVAERRDLHRRPQEADPLVVVRPARARSRSRSGRSGAGFRTCRRSSSREAANTALPPACAPCAGSQSSTPRRHRGCKLDRPLERTRFRTPTRSGRRA